MINLIRNELYKIFHKKGIYITLIITTLFCLLTNAIYNSDLFNSNAIDTNIELEISFSSSMEETDDTDSEEYIDSQTYIETYEYAKSFGENSWQRVILTNDLEYNSRMTDIIKRIVSYEKNYTLNKLDYENALLERDALTTELKAITSKEYLDNKIKKVKENIILSESLDKQLTNMYKSELETLKLRKKYNIEYAFNEMNNNLQIFQDNYQIILEYEKKDKDTLKKMDKLTLQEAEKNVAISKAAIENNIYSDNIGISTIIENFYNEFFLMILIIIILVSGSIVSDEFSKGTIKLLLVKPYSRTKILMSKYIASLIMVLFSILTILLLEIIIGGLFFGYETLSIPTIIYNYSTKTIEMMNIFKYFGIRTLAVLPQLILIATISFTLSTIFTSTSLANTLTIIGVFGSDLINSIAQTFEIGILKYIVTLNWDWSVYLFGGISPYKGVTFPFSVVICIFYWVLMLIITTIIFNKRNIKNI